MVDEEDAATHAEAAEEEEAMKEPGKHVWIVRLNDSIRAVYADPKSAREHMKRYRERNQESGSWAKIHDDRWHTPDGPYTLWNECWSVLQGGQ
ncbi:hypothetical protein LCGC14_2455550 [marine sediment metagenome]|uniref:Uncharacterized protein n=1 Tax=marine sediment metagenome TaxID=412755 RepID=A0A0F9DRY9_9ZZZZ